MHHVFRDWDPEWRMRFSLREYALVVAAQRSVLRSHFVVKIIKMKDTLE